MIQIAEPITLEKLLPLIERLSKVEREQLRKFLEVDSTMWREEWESTVAHFPMPSSTPQRTNWNGILMRHWQR